MGSRQPAFEIVVSAENNPYLAWQAMLFHYSCVTRQKQTPVIMVHAQRGERLRAGFRWIRAAGGDVRRAPDYRRVGGVNYPPRHTAATLRHLETTADYIVLCDPDMLFLRSLPRTELRLADDQVSFDFCGYLQPDAPVYQPTLDRVCRSAGVEPSRLRTPVIDGGVPHVVPRGVQRTLSDEWLAIIELFPTMPPTPLASSGARTRGLHVGPQKDWLATMWAVLLATHRLGLSPVLTRLATTNFQGTRPLADLQPPPHLLHYCYVDPGFNKHDFETSRDMASRVWQVPPGDATICGAIRRQLHAAREFYGR